MTQYFSGSNTTRREDLLDTLILRQSYSTPMLAMLPQKSITSIIHEWPIVTAYDSTTSVRSLSDPHANSRREGSDFSFTTPEYATRLRCIPEIQHFGMEMSGSNRSANVAGMDSTWDYETGRLFTKLLNAIDHLALYGQGSPETGGGTATSGGTTAGDERRMQGLISWAAWTGLERMHGSKTTAIEDPYGVSIPPSFWSVFYDAAHVNLSQDLFFNNILTPLLQNGADLESKPWIFQCGYRLMARIARFLIADGGIILNDRNRSADDGMGSDYINWFKFPTGHTVGFRTNRWLNETGSTYSFANNDYTPGSPTAEGSISARTLYADQTLIGHEPETVSFAWYREPAFRKVETAGDYGRIACVAEFSLEVGAPLCVGGGANLLG